MRWTIFAICSWIKWEENVYSIPKLNGWLSSSPRYIRDFFFSFLISYETDLRICFHFSFFLTSLIFNQLKYIDEMKKKSQIFQYTQQIFGICQFCSLLLLSQMWTEIKDVVCCGYRCRHCYWNVFFFLFLILTFFFILNSSEIF